MARQPITIVQLVTLQHSILRFYCARAHESVHFTHFKLTPPHAQIFPLITYFRQYTPQCRLQTALWPCPRPVLF